MALRVLVGTELLTVETGRDRGAEVDREEELVMEESAVDLLCVPPTADPETAGLATLVDNTGVQYLEETMLGVTFTVEFVVHVEDLSQSTVCVQGVVTGGIPSPPQPVLLEVDGQVWTDLVVGHGEDVKGCQIEIVTGEDSEDGLSVSFSSLAKEVSGHVSDVCRAALLSMVVVDLAVLIIGS